MTGDLDEPVLLYRRFTWRDIIRLVSPSLGLLRFVDSGATSMVVLAVLLGTGLGVLWYLVRPYGQPLETYLYHRLR